MGLSLHEKKMLIHGARSAVTDFLEKGVLDEASSQLPDPPQALQEARGVFVTVYDAGRPRGCMGMPTAMLPLWKACRVCARNAACRDPRFVPLSIEELPHVSFEITAMGTPRPFTDTPQIHGGNFGLMLQKGFRREVFMPGMVQGARGGREEIMRYLRDKVSIDADGEDAPETWMVFEVEVIAEDDL